MSEIIPRLDGAMIMARTAARIKQSEITAVVKGAIKGGGSVAEIFISDDGVSIRLGEPTSSGSEDCEELEVLIAAAANKIRQ